MIHCGRDAHDRNRDDPALAATARLRGLVVANYNIRHFRGRGVRVLDPFDAAPMVMGDNGRVLDVMLDAWFRSTPPHGGRP